MAASCLLAISAEAQSETIFGNNALGLSGIWYNNTHNFSFYDEESKYFSGGTIDLEFGNRLLLGWAWQRMRDDLDIEAVGESFKLRHNGLKLGYIPLSNRVLHPYFSAYAGGGEIDIIGGDDDRIFGINGAAGVEINVTGWFRLGLEGGYRYITDVDIPGLSDEDFSAPFGQLNLRFGFSWGY